MALLDTDLLYLSRGDVLYQVDAKKVRDKTDINPDDEFVVQRAGDLYKVVIGEVWNGTTLLESGDLFLVQRGSDLFAHAMVITSFVTVKVTGTGLTWKMDLNYVPDGEGNPAKVELPDGSSITPVKGENTFTQTGVYRFSGTWTSFKNKSLSGNVEVDYSIDDAPTWARAMSKVDDFGQDLFRDIISGASLKNIPAGLILKSANNTFSSTTFGIPDPDSSGNPVEFGATTLDVSAVTDFTATFRQCDSDSFTWSVDQWDTSSGENFNACFAQTFTLNDPGCGAWDVSNATNMASMFLLSGLDADLSTWTPSNVVNVANMFNSATSFDSDLSGWKMTKLQTMSNMFSGASAFNSPPPTNIGEVTNAGGVFTGCRLFNKPILWDFAKVENISNILYGASAFNSDVSGWNLSNCTDISAAFFGATPFNQPCDRWDVSKVTNMSLTFARAGVFNQDIGEWDTESLTAASSMFLDAAAFNQDLSGWCVSNVLYEPMGFDSGSGFEGQTDRQPQWGTCPNTTPGKLTILSGGVVKFNGIASEDCQVNLANGNVANIRKGSFAVSLSSAGDYELPMKFITAMNFYGTSTSSKFTFEPDFYTKKVTNMANLFNNCKGFNGDVSNWDTSNVTNLSNSFKNCSNFNQSISKWNTSSVQNASNMFNNASNFNQDMTYMDWSSCQLMGSLFFQAANFNGDIAVWRTSNVTNMSCMFYRCNQFDQSLNAWDTSSVTNTANMFNMANVFNQPLDLWDMSNVTCMRSMFYNAKQYEQDLSGWCTTSLPSSSKPTYFDQNAKFANQTALQPTWQSCPPQPIRGIIPVVQTVGGGYTADPGDTIAKIEDGALKLGDGTLIAPTSQQWQFRTSPNDEWADITGETGDTYTVVATDLGYDIALKQHFTHDGQDVDQLSNIISIEAVPVTGFMGFTVFPGATVNFGGTLTDAAVLTKPDDSTVNLSAGPFNQALSDEGFYYLESTDLVKLTFENSDGQFLLDPRSDLDNVVDVSKAFKDCQFYNQGLSWWDTNAVTNFSEMFSGAISFNGDISSWTLTSAQNMSGMFSNAQVFNKTLGLWNTSTVTDMSSMFAGAEAFNQSIGAWKVEAVTNMASMFKDAAAFDSYIGLWQPESSEDFSGMFDGATIFNQPLQDWNVGEATNMDSMFQNAAAYSQNLNDWCVEEIFNEPANFATGSGFEGDKALHPKWGTCILGKSVITVPEGGNLRGNITAPAGSYYVKPNGDQVDFTTKHSFNETAAGTYVFQMQGVTAVHFSNSSGAIQFSSDFFTGDVTNMSNLFRQTKNGFSPDISNWDVSRVTNFSYAFFEDRTWNPDITGWDVSNGVSFTNMFRNCLVFNQDISSWRFTTDPDKQVDLTAFLWGCKEFDKDLNSWTFGRVNSAKELFNGCNKFNGAVGAWDTANCRDFGGVFKNCNLFNQPLTNWTFTKLANGRTPSISGAWENAYVFNQPIAHLDMSNSGHMGAVFSNAREFNQDMSHLQLNGSSSMWGFFKDAHAFNGAIFCVNTAISHTSNFNFGNMFMNCHAFNQSIAHWNLEKVSTTKEMFRNATIYNQDLSNLCVGGLESIDATNAANMFLDSGMDGETAFYPQFGDDCGGADSTAQFTLKKGTMSIQIYVQAPLKAKLTHPDGVEEEYTGSKIIGLTTLGTYTIETGKLEEIRFKDVSEKDGSGFEIVLPFDWGRIKTMAYMFDSCDIDQDLTTLDVSNITNMYRAFSYGNLYGATNCAGWDVSNVTSFNSMFHSNKEFNGDVGWTTMNAPLFRDMFHSTAKFEGKGLENWQFMSDEPHDFRSFARVSREFNPDLSAWAPYSQKFFSLTSMFDSCSKFTGQGLENWNMNHDVEDGSLYCAFQSTNITNQLTNWKVTNLTNLEKAWSSPQLTSDFANWDFSQVIKANDLFRGARLFDGEIGTGPEGKPFQSVVNAVNMFHNASNFNSSMEGFEVGALANAAGMFNNCSAFNQDISNWDMRSVNNAYNMLRNASAFNQDLSSWCTPNATQFGYATSGTQLTANMEPQWGTCPTGPSQLAVIRSQNGTIPVTPPTTIELVSDTVVPDGTLPSGNQWQRSINAGSQYLYGTEYGVKPTEQGFFYAGPSFSGLQRDGYNLNEWNYIWMAPTDTQGDGTFYNALTDPANKGRYLLMGVQGNAAIYKIINGPSSTYGFAAEVQYQDYEGASPVYNPGDNNFKCNWWIGDALGDSFWEDISGQTGDTLAVDSTFSGRAVRIGQQFNGSGSFERMYYSAGLSIDYT